MEINSEKMKQAYDEYVKVLMDMDEDFLEKDAETYLDNNIEEFFNWASKNGMNKMDLIREEYIQGMVKNQNLDLDLATKIALRGPESAMLRWANSKGFEKTDSAPIISDVKDEDKSQTVDFGSLETTKIDRNNLKDLIPDISGIDVMANNIPDTSGIDVLVGATYDDDLSDFEPEEAKEVAIPATASQVVNVEDMEPSRLKKITDKISNTKFGSFFHKHSHKITLAVAGFVLAATVGTGLYSCSQTQVNDSVILTSSNEIVPEAQPQSSDNEIVAEAQLQSSDIDYSSLGQGSTTYYTAADAEQQVNPLEANEYYKTDLLYAYDNSSNSVIPITEEQSQDKEFMGDLSSNPNVSFLFGDSAGNASGWNSADQVNDVVNGGKSL